LVVADRAYGTLNGMKHCLNCGADYILRLRTNGFSVYDENGNKIDIAGRFAELKEGKTGKPRFLPYFQTKHEFRRGFV
jgi:hypothetical protein